MEKVWLDQYQKAIPHDVKTIHPSVTAYFDDTVVKYKDRPAFACLGKTLSFDQLRETVETIANWFQNELGIKKGDKVALMMPNLLQYPTALFGALKAGATVVNVNPLYTPRELEHQLKDSGAETIVILANFAKTLETVLPNVQMKNVIITEMGDLLGFPKGPLINFVIKKIKKMVPEYNIPRVIAFKELLKPRTTEFKPVTVNEDDIAFLQYTGGTTGASKGAILTHKNVCINFTQAQQFLQERMTPETDIIITALPIYHIFSLVCNCMMFMNQGALNVLIPNPRDMDGFVKELGKWKFTSISAVNTLFNGLLHHPQFADLDFSSLQLCLGGGMAVQESVADKWQKTTGCVITQCYGLTETSPAAVICDPTKDKFTGSIGLPIPSTEVSIQDKDNNILPYGERGEVCIRGPQIMAGYLNRPDATAEAITSDGWFHSGDIGTMDDKGNIFIVDRLKDMIIVSGFNVYPNEIEDVMVGHDNISEAAAIGIPDQKSGEVVKLYIVKENDSLTEEQVMSYCRENLTGYKVPKQIEFLDELPKTNVGKILRRKLKPDQAS